MTLGSGSLRLGGVERRLLRPGFPGRLRSIFSTPAHAKKPAPRSRFGHPFLPGLALLGRQHLAAARPFLERAYAVRGRRFTHLGRTVGFPGRIDWEPEGRSQAWCEALHGLDGLVAAGLAAALAPRVEVRRRWYRVAADLVREWMGGVAPGRGVGWQLPALARRIPNLLYAHVLFATELRADPATQESLLESLYAQAVALAAAVPGAAPDHRLIHAGRALFMAGRFFEGAESDGWLENGAAILWSQLRDQVNEDGGHRERNPARHAQVLADYLEVFAIMRAANDDVPIWARKRVKGMADFLARMCHPDGEIPLFHGAAIGVAPPAGELLATAAVVLHEPELASPGDLPGVWPLLILGEAGRRVHARLSRRRGGAEARALRRTGFYVLPGDPDDVMLLDGDSPPADGDQGVFGYELSVGGRRLIIDSGTGAEQRPPWAEYFRSTRAHNVVSIGGAEQSALGRPPAIADLHWAVRSGLLYFEGTHDGFAHLALDLRLGHRRRVFCLPGRFWVVCDEIVGTGVWEAESFVHFHPAVVLSACHRGHLSFTAARSGAARVQIVPSGAQEVRVVCGTGEPNPQGWYAPRPRERSAAQVLSLVTGGRLPLVFGYALLPRSEGAAELRLEHDAFRLSAMLRTGGQEYVLSALQGDVEMTVRPLGTPSGVPT